MKRTEGYIVAVVSLIAGCIASKMMMAQHKKIVTVDVRKAAEAVARKNGGGKKSDLDSAVLKLKETMEGWARETGAVVLAKQAVLAGDLEDMTDDFVTCIE